MADGQRFTWVDTYEKIADELFARRNRRDSLHALYVKLTDADDRVEIDPLTFFSTFNRNIIEVDRKGMIADIIGTLGIDARVPADFRGVPTSSYEDWQHFDNTAESAELCWRLFEAALALADTPDEERQGEGYEHVLREFCECFDAIHAQEHVTKARLTRVLFWMRPGFFLPYGEKTRDYVHSRFGVEAPIQMRGAQYLRMLQELGAVADRPFVEISERAYRAHHEDWWPDIQDFDPDMSIHQWMELLGDGEFTSPEVLAALRKMRKMGGDATCDELADERGRDRDWYATLLRGYARKVGQHLGRSSYKGSWWPYLFVGQNAGAFRNGDYVWKLRDEIDQALEALEG